MSIIKGNNELRDVTGISNEEKKAILCFLQGAVYCWCKNRKNEWFSMRDLMGGDNYEWQGTPLYVLYEKHIKKGNLINDAIQDAGKDSGWLLKTCISNDVRQFKTKKDEMIRKYKWISEK